MGDAAALVPAVRTESGRASAGAGAAPGLAGFARALGLRRLRGGRGDESGAPEEDDILYLAEDAAEEFGEQDQEGAGEEVGVFSRVREMGARLPHATDERVVRFCFWGLRAGHGVGLSWFLEVKAMRLPLFVLF
jgi:hypothetical protein